MRIDPSSKHHSLPANSKTRRLRASPAFQSAPNSINDHIHASNLQIFAQMKTLLQKVEDSSYGDLPALKEELQNTLQQTKTWLENDRSSHVDKTTFLAALDQLDQAIPEINDGSISSGIAYSKAYDAINTLDHLFVQIQNPQDATQPSTQLGFIKDSYQKVFTAIDKWVSQLGSSNTLSDDQTTALASTQRDMFAAIDSALNQLPSIQNNQPYFDALNALKKWTTNLYTPSSSTATSSDVPLQSTQSNPNLGLAIGKVYEKLKILHDLLPWQITLSRVAVKQPSNVDTSDPNYGALGRSFNEKGTGTLVFETANMRVASADDEGQNAWVNRKDDCIADINNSARGILSQKGVITSYSNRDALTESDKENIASQTVQPTYDPKLKPVSLVAIQELDDGQQTDDLVNGLQPPLEYIRIGSGQAMLYNHNDLEPVEDTEIYKNLGNDPKFGDASWNTDRRFGEQRFKIVGSDPAVYVSALSIHGRHPFGDSASDVTNQFQTIIDTFKQRALERGDIFCLMGDLNTMNNPIYLNDGQGYLDLNLHLTNNQPTKIVDFNKDKIITDPALEPTEAAPTDVGDIGSINDLIMVNAEGTYTPNLDNSTMKILESSTDHEFPRAQVEFKNKNFKK